MTKCISSFIIEVVFLSFSIHSWIQPQHQQVINGILQLRKHLIGCKAFFHFSLWSGRLGVHCYLAQLNHSWTLVILLGGSCDYQRLGNRTPRPNKVVHRRRAGPGGPFPITVHLMWGISKIVFRCGPCSLLVVVVNVSPLSPFPRSTTIECHRGTEVRIAGNGASSCSQSRPEFHQGPDIRGRCLLQKAL